LYVIFNIFFVLIAPTATIKSKADVARKRVLKIKRSNAKTQAAVQNIIQDEDSKSDLSSDSNVAQIFTLKPYMFEEPGFLQRSRDIYTDKMKRYKSATKNVNTFRNEVKVVPKLLGTNIAHPMYLNSDGVWSLWPVSSMEISNFLNMYHGNTTAETDFDDNQASWIEDQVLDPDLADDSFFPSASLNATFNATNSVLSKCEHISLFEYFRSDNSLPKLQQNSKNNEGMGMLNLIRQCSPVHAPDSLSSGLSIGYTSYAQTNPYYTFKQDKVVVKSKNIKPKPQIKSPTKSMKKQATSIGNALVVNHTEQNIQVAKQLPVLDTPTLVAPIIRLEKSSIAPALNRLSEITGHLYLQNSKSMQPNRVLDMQTLKKVYASSGVQNLDALNVSETNTSNYVSDIDTSVSSNLHRDMIDPWTGKNVHETVTMRTKASVRTST
jgi:hypothetical protein